MPGLATPRVLLLSAAGKLGGAERSFFELACALKSEAVEVFVSAPPESDLQHLCESAGLRVSPVSVRRLRRTLGPLKLAAQWRALRQSARAIRDVCRENRVDVIHANTDSAALAAWAAQRIGAPPFIWHCRDLHGIPAIARLLAKRAMAVIAISSAVNARLLKIKVPGRKIRLIPNGIDLSRFTADRDVKRAELRRGLKLRPDQPVLLGVGAYVPWKRHEDFVRIVAAVARRVPEVAGLLAGSDLFDENSAYSRELKETIAHEKLSAPRFQLLGQRDDIPALMRAADVLVSCSMNEPFGRVLAEAAACGLPVVSTDSGGKAEIVADGVTGRLVEPENVEAMAGACVTLLSDPAMRNRMGSAARLRAEKAFDIRRVAREAAGLYLEIRDKEMP